MKRVVVIGGGITGLAAAHRLTELKATSTQQFEIILLEAGSRLGGVIHTEDRDGYLIERGPDSFISEKPAALNLAHRIGLETHLIETNPHHRRSFIVRNGRLRNVPDGFQLMAPSRLWPFITSDIFSWPGKARMALDLLIPRRVVNGESDESLAAFVRRRLGKEALERMAQPMVGGIYTADPEHLSLRATLPRFLDMESTNRSLILALFKGSKQKQESGTSGARYSLFLSFDRGMQLLSDRLASLLEAQVRLETRVKTLSFKRASKQWQIELESGDAISADAVCLALPAYVSASLLSSADGPLADELKAIPYESTATINLAYNRSDIHHPLDGFGFVVPFIEKRALLACTFSSVKFSRRAPEGCALLRAFAGGALQPEMFDLDDGEMLARVKSDLNELLGITNAPLFTTIARWPRSMPQYHVGHLDRVRRIEERTSRLPLMALAGNAYRGPGIPDCIRSGEVAAESLVAQLKA